MSDYGPFDDEKNWNLQEILADLLAKGDVPPGTTIDQLIVEPYSPKGGMDIPRVNPWEAEDALKDLLKSGDVPPGTTVDQILIEPSDILNKGMTIPGIQQQELLMKLLEQLSGATP